MRRVRLVIAGVVLAVEILGGCAPKAAGRVGSTPALDRSELILWHDLRSGPRLTALLSLVDEFNRGNPWHITVVPELAATSGLRDRLLSAAAHGQSPDLVLADPPTVADFGNRKIVVDLSPFLNDPNWGFSQKDRSDLLPAVLTPTLALPAAPAITATPVSKPATPTLPPPTATVSPTTVLTATSAGTPSTTLMPTVTMTASARPEPVATIGPIVSLTSAAASAPVILPPKPPISAPVAQTPTWTTSALSTPGAGSLEVPSPHFGLPIGLQMWVLVYNADRLAKLGVNQPPRTWDEFSQLCQKATQHFPEDNRNDRYGLALSDNGLAVPTWMMNRGGQPLDLTTDGPLSARRAALDSLRMLRGLLDSGCAYAPAIAGADRADFARGKVLFTFASTADLPAYKAEVSSLRQFNWSIAALPGALDSPVVLGSGPMLGVMHTTADHQLASWLFVRWMAESNQTRQWAERTGMFPIRRSVATAMSKAETTDPVTRAGLAMLEYVRLEPALAIWPDVERALNQVVLRVIGGEAPGDALDAATEKIDRLLRVTGKGH